MRQIQNPPVFIEWKSLCVCAQASSGLGCRPCGRTALRQYARALTYAYIVLYDNYRPAGHRMPLSRNAATVTVVNQTQ